MINIQNSYKIFILILFIIFMQYPIYPAEPQLYIDTVDRVSSGEYFTVSVFDPSLKNTTPYLVNVLVIFNNKEYVITEEENGEITLLAPQVITNTTYKIEAYKEDYRPGFKNITVIPAKHNHSSLVITLKSFIVSANEKFLVLVTDEEGIPIENVTVRIENFTGKETTGLTDKNGYTYLKAPNIKEITIIAQKEGYNKGFKKLMITTVSSGPNSIIQNPHTPLIIAAAVLVIAIIYVYLRGGENILNFDRRRYPSENKKIITQNTVREENTKLHPIRIENKSKVEEIYITKPKDDKKIIQINKEDDFPWFTDNQHSDIQREIDNLTSKINEQETWFEGLDEVKEKIDRKIRKYKQ